MSRTYPLLVLALLLAGAFVVVSTFAFGSSALTGIAFGVSIGTAWLGLIAAVAAPSRAARALNAGVVLVSAWTILVSVGLFTGATQTWLIFAAGAAIAAVAAAASAADDLRRTEAETAPLSVPSAFSVKAA